ncbi:DUF2878 domain-containing protein [Thalassotalea aquiviva]|uniref:DUF2878 domain-containing protein n=1 Tax=Thalassotalea aquiviva TaxID=3242415 RepID=UPI003529D831
MFSNNPSSSSAFTQGLIFNGTLFNVVWLVCVAIKNIPLATLVLICWVVIRREQLKHWPYLAILAGVGLCTDFILVNLLWMQFNSAILPSYALVVLWLAFSFFTLTLFKTFNWRYYQLALLSVISGPLSYLAAQKLNGVQINWDDASYTGAFMVFWLGCLPLAKYLHRRF